MPPFADHFRHRRRALFCVLGALALVLGGWAARERWQRPDPLLISPRLALDSLTAKALYYNGPAAPWLRSLRPEVLPPADRAEGSARAREMAQAVQSPRLFRQLDRRERFDALLLIGDPSQYKPLLDHLVETSDWRLRYADHTSLIFHRGGESWQLPDFAPVRARVAPFRPRERASVLAQTATRLLAAGQPEAARALLDEASQLVPKHAEVGHGLAVYHLGRGAWREAAEHLERALAADRKSVPALATKIQLLHGTKRFGEAYALSKQLIARVPEDPGLLFYHAKIAHDAHAYKAEIAALEKLIAWAEADRRPVGGYLLYLGQAYAATGEARRSVDSFMNALNDPDLPDDQRAFARENIARIKTRTGL